jgi:hypothetical protein
MKKSVFPKTHIAVEQLLTEQEALTKQLFPASDANKSSWSTLNTPQLADHCLKELDHYHRGEPYTDVYGIELLRRATILDDPQAWERMQYCFGSIVLAWLRRHPSREMACRLENEEYYVAQTFERFWQATTLAQRVTFRTLAAALRYLQMSLNGAILDSLRANKRSKEIPLPEAGELGEPCVEDVTFSSEVWEVIQSLLPDKREKRLAYLLFYCGLKAREIVRFLPEEWSDVHDIYRINRSIMERLSRNADQLRWRLS